MLLRFSPLRTSTTQPLRFSRGELAEPSVNWLRYPQVRKRYTAFVLF